MLTMMRWMRDEDVISVVISYLSYMPTNFPCFKISIETIKHTIRYKASMPNLMNSRLLSNN